jgi:hypothetical protein
MDVDSSRIKVLMRIVGILGPDSTVILNTPGYAHIPAIHADSRWREAIALSSL